MARGIVRDLIVKNPVLPADVLQDAIFNSANFSSIATDANGVIQIFNVGAEHMLGYSAAAVVNKMTPADLSDPGELVKRAEKLSFEFGSPIAPGFEALIYKANRSTEDIYELTYIRKDGSRFPATVSVTALKDADKKIIGYLLIGTDNTARQRALEMQRESDEKFKYLFDFSAVGNSITSLTGVIQVNHAFCAMLGYSAEELKLRHWQEITHPDDIDLQVKENAQLLSGDQQSVRYTKRYTHKHGHTIWCNVSTALRRDTAGQPLYFMTSVLDITELKRAEAELRGASLYARRLLEASLDPLVTISSEGKLTDVNEAAISATGISREKLIGSDFSDYFTEPEKARAGYQEVFAKGFVRDFPLIVRHTSGETRDVLYNASLYRNEKGEVAGAFAAARDVTELKHAEADRRESEERHRALINNLSTGIVVHGSDTSILLCNPKAAELLGFTVDQMRSKIASDPSFFFVRDDGTPLPLAEYPVNRLLASANGFQGLVLGISRTEPTKIVWVSCDAYPVKNAQGQVVQAVVSFADITEQKNAREIIHQLNESLELRVAQRTAQLAEANSELESFAYSVSHDLRTPLRAIDGFSHQLLNRYADKVDDEGKRYLNIVRQSAQKMGQLIDDILAFSRMGRTQMAKSEIDMDELVREVFGELKPVIADRNLTLDTKALPACHGDRAMLRQVWVNLLSNAIKFTAPRAAAQVEVSGSAEGAELIYSIKDNGAGFDMRYAEKLFGVFQRLHSNEEFEGTGIGLAIVKRIVTRHGGRVWAEGAVDQGATVYFALPVL